MMARARVRLGLLPIIVVLSACFGGGGSPITGSGKGFPELKIEFPPVVEAGSTETATINVTNPGPEELPSLLITFALVGTETPLVTIGSDGSNPSIAGVEPEPVGVSDDGVIYRFGGLEEGESVELAFDIVIPDVRGPVANSVTVTDGNDVERARGVRLETVVRG